MTSSGRYYICDHFVPKDSGRKVYGERFTDRHLANENVPAIDLYFRA